MAYLADVIPRVVMHKVFRCNITVEAIPSNQNWWFQSCDQCSWKAVQDGDGLMVISVQSQAVGVDQRDHSPLFP